jgi:hypothetical protein
MRQQAGALDDLGSGGVKVAKRVVVACGFEPIGRLRVTKLRLVAGLAKVQ